ncbi:nuclear transport factor 2 family protein [Novosphingobium sp. KCTC 2891]|uniref:nuclear transport factor 2 family protein n=1 Tax=Novosphingobium sp. KCTC 2891 TaxID=2989730 RepID=UPI002222E0B2|nr:nuclear transport factor 2 family protein [Novosphingobium sp. KCTC 2891]MCW1384948.1 nuclear transport factor 2 family protein [Novosphingobium sp. KCTC 2891]
MLKLSILLSAVAAVIGSSQASATPAAPAAEEGSERQGLLDLSRQKWLWMAERDISKLEPLFHPAAHFVHMGTTMDRAGELDVISTGRIHYKHAEISDMSVELIGDTAIVISRLRLVAVVGGNEVTNPFSVTETYVRQDRRWQLAAMAFTRLLGE